MSAKPFWIATVPARQVDIIEGNIVTSTFGLSGISISYSVPQYSHFNVLSDLISYSLAPQFIHDLCLGFIDIDALYFRVAIIPACI